MTMLDAFLTWAHQPSISSARAAAEPATSTPTTNASRAPIMFPAPSASPRYREGTRRRPPQARLAGRRQGQAKFGDVLPITDTIIRTGSDEAMLAFLRAMQERAGTHLYRKEMFFAMRSALQIKSTGRYESLPDAVWEVQNRIRHAGRKFAKRSIGSTLLVKGLEFDHAVIVHAANMTRKDWYVALTRATKSVRVVSLALRFTPAA